MPWRWDCRLFLLLWAVRGVDGVDGEHLLIRDEPAQIAKAILAVDRDRILWTNLRTKGRNLVEERYDWQAIYAEFEAKLFEAWQKNVKVQHSGPPRFNSRNDNESL